MTVGQSAKRFSCEKSDSSGYYHFRLSICSCFPFITFTRLLRCIDLLCKISSSFIWSILAIDHDFALTLEVPSKHLDQIIFEESRSPSCFWANICCESWPLSFFHPRQGGIDLSMSEFPWFLLKLSSLERRLWHHGIIYVQNFKFVSKQFRTENKLSAGKINWERFTNLTADAMKWKHVIRTILHQWKSRNADSFLSLRFTLGFGKKRLDLGNKFK